MIIDLFDESENLTEEQSDLLLQVLGFIAKKEQFNEDAELSVSIVTNEEIQALNKQYRQKDIPTDVLSFPMLDETMLENKAQFAHIPLALGDIIISIDKVYEQAETYGHSFERELNFLAVHGFLHLIGYTHDTAEEEKHMFEKQEQVLKEFHLERQ